VSTHQHLASFIWSVADLLRGDYKQSEYGKVILPLTVLRRLDCVMEPTRQAVWDRNTSIKLANKDHFLRLAAGLPFYNTSKQSFASIGASAPDVEKNLVDYINGFSANAREIIDKYEFHTQIARLKAAKLLYPVVQKFADVDLHLDRVDNHQMGYVFEELIRRFSEISNETAGEHFTPREVIKLMVHLLIGPDTAHLTEPGKVINILDPACGTGGMLSAAEDLITSLNPNATVKLFGQELNAESYAICRSDMMLKGQDPTNIYFGNSFGDDGHQGKRFDYMLANPPFGSSGRRSGTPSRTRPNSGTPADSAPDCPASTTAPSCSCSTCCPRWSPRRKVARASPSSSMDHRSSPGLPSPASRTSAAGSSRTTCSKASSACQTSSSTTPASRRTSGSSLTTSPTRSSARSSCSTPATSGSRCARASATSARWSPTTRSGT
jgi:methylase of polypeptide subunit release factors